MDIKKIKKAIQNKVEEELTFNIKCKSCGEHHDLKVNFKSEMMVCTNCGTSQEISEEIYLEVFKELQKIGVELI